MALASDMAEARRVVLAVSGSIAAFKAAQLASDMVKLGWQVRVVLTDGGAHFITPLTFEALTGNPVAASVWEEMAGSTRMGHLELARWAEVLVVAPASAGTIARLALGLPDDMLGSVALAYAGPIVIAPAMETNMFRHPATQEHVSTLRSRGATVIGPTSGRLASGAEGEGRMVEPSEILDALRAIAAGAQTAQGDLAGRRVLVAAGPTREAIDPVRYISNRSSGKMGFAVAEEARDRGAHVTLVSGPTDLTIEGVDVVRVESAAEMRDAVVSRAPDQDVIVMSAAVGDFRPATSARSKTKRSGPVTLELLPTDDIAAAASSAAPTAIHIGFALETENLVEAAREKLERKGQDLVVANELSRKHNPFGSETNTVFFVTQHSVRELPEMPKRQVAAELWNEVAILLEGRSHDLRRGHS